MRAQPPMPASFLRPARGGTCRWCDTPILKPDGSVNLNRKWHPACADDFNVVTNPGAARQAARKRAKNTCQRCGKPTRKKLNPGDCDHVKPLCLYGHELDAFRLSNLQWLCRKPCHQEKTAADIRTWREANGLTGAVEQFMESPESIAAREFAVDPADE